jgi:hypothetical protein
MDWRSELGVNIDSIKSQVIFLSSQRGLNSLMVHYSRYIKKIRRFAEDWAQLSRMQAYLRERDIKGEVTEQHTHLYAFGRDFQVRVAVW